MSRNREYVELEETPKKRGNTLKVTLIAAVLVLIAIACLIGGIYAIMNKDSTAPNTWLISGFSHLFEKTDEADFIVEVKFRPSGGDVTTWGDTIIAEVGARVDVRIQYANRSPDKHDNVAVWCNLPSCLVYEEGSTKLYNSPHPDGLIVDQETIASQGLFIGSYEGYEKTGSPDKHGANAYLYFTMEVVDNGLPEAGDNEITLSTSVQAGPSGDTPTTIQQNSNIIIRK